MTDPKIYVMPIDTPVHLTEKGRMAPASRQLAKHELTPEALDQIAVLIWGLQWQHRLAAEFYYNPTTVKRWMQGKRVIPPTLWPSLRDRLLQTSADAKTMAMTLPTEPRIEE